MAINENDLYDKVSDALAAYTQGDYENEKESPRHMSIMGDTMKAYFEKNITITHVQTGLMILSIKAVSALSDGGSTNGFSTKST